MNTTELLAVFREEVFDKQLPYLWSDALVYGYIDDAQKQFCRFTFGIDDARSHQLNVAPGVEWYDINPKITRLFAANHATTGREIPILSLDQVISSGKVFDGSTGQIECFVRGLEHNKLRAYPVPSVAAVVNLRTQRLPADVASGGVFEINEQHHRNLLDWVKYRAYNVQDAEAINEPKADKHQANFIQYCRDSKTEQGRMRRPVAVVSYGGI